MDKYLILPDFVKMPGSFTCEYKKKFTSAYFCKNLQFAAVFFAQKQRLIAILQINARNLTLESLQSGRKNGV